MNKHHNNLLDDAKKAADELHADLTVSPQQTLESLRELHEHVGELIMMVTMDIDDAEG